MKLDKNNDWLAWLAWLATRMRRGSPFSLVLDVSKMERASWGMASFRGFPVFGGVLDGLWVIDQSGSRRLATWPVRGGSRPPGSFVAQVWTISWLGFPVLPDLARLQALISVADFPEVHLERKKKEKAECESLF